MTDTLFDIKMLFGPSCQFPVVEMMMIFLFMNSISEKQMGVKKISFENKNLTTILKHA
jgi:hypothetical protein